MGCEGRHVVSCLVSDRCLPHLPAHSLTRPPVCALPRPACACACLPSACACDGAGQGLEGGAGHPPRAGGRRGARVTRALPGGGAGGGAGGRGLRRASRFVFPVHVSHPTRGVRGCNARCMGLGSLGEGGHHAAAAHHRSIPGQESGVWPTFGAPKQPLNQPSKQPLPTPTLSPNPLPPTHPHTTTTTTHTHHPPHHPHRSFGAPSTPA